MSALTIVQGATARLGLTVPTAVFLSVDPQVVQLRALMNQEGQELTRRHDWTALQTQWTFNTTAAEAQVNGRAPDFDHIVNATMWDRTTNRPVYGPLNPQEWQREKAGPTFSSVYYAFRFRGADLLMTPTPAAGDAVYYEYISNLWAVDTPPTTGKVAMTADTDVAKIPERLMVLGVIWRFLAAKGLSYAEQRKTYDDEVDAEVSRDGGAPTLSLSSTMPYRRMTPNIPEGNWPG